MSEAAGQLTDCFGTHQLGGALVHTLLQGFIEATKHAGHSISFGFHRPPSIYVE